MSNDVSTAEKVETESLELTADQVAEYLRLHPEFFSEQEDLLAELSLPHDSGKAISLLERQVTILRERGIEARQKLNNLLANARNNDQLFDTTRNLVLALLRAKDITELVNVTQDQLANHTSIDACEIILVDFDGINVANTVRVESEAKLKQDFSDVFRLKRTHCGPLESSDIAYLFPNNESIRSTALCPVMHNSHILAMIAFGNQEDNYFNVNLDTLFLDFIGRVIGAVLDREIASTR